jgi:hypothetical protein
VQAVRVRAPARTLECDDGPTLGAATSCAAAVARQAARGAPHPKTLFVVFGAVNPSCGQTTNARRAAPALRGSLERADGVVGQLEVVAATDQQAERALPATIVPRRR